jgi:hypothetical protein
MNDPPVEAAQRDGTAGAWREITLWRIRLKRRFDFQRNRSADLI